MSLTPDEFVEMEVLRQENAHLKTELSRWEALSLNERQRTDRANAEIRRLRCDYSTLAHAWRTQAPRYGEPEVAISICERLVESSRRRYPWAGD
jgi:hypothetical protein